MLELYTFMMLLMQYEPGLVRKIMSHMNTYTFKTKEELQVAVNEWCQDKEAALKKYGDILWWDVSQITDMSGLFKDKQDFNDNIWHWDVSNVINME